MSTRSRIGILNINGSIESVCCHFDGYPKHHQPILQESYKTEKRVRRLLSFGNISILSNKIGRKHDFSLHFDNETAQKEDWCLFYDRDKGEEDQAPLKSNNIEELMSICNDSWACYLYLFDVNNNKWLFCDLLEEDKNLIEL